jgi:hypothetical protein
MAQRLKRAIVAAALALAAAGIAQAQAFPYRVELSPVRPVVGGELQLDLVVQGLSARGMELVELSADKALSLESQTTEPYVEPGGIRAAELRLVFRVKRAGRLEIGRLILRSKEGSLVVAPLSFVAEAPFDSAGIREEPWLWEAPPTVYRYESFSIDLRSALDENGDSSSKGVAASFAAPLGASLEASGALSWTMTVLDQGTIALPEAIVSENGKMLGRAPGREIRVLPLPPEIETSRAIGTFELSLEGLEGARPRAGEALVFRLVLSGRGDLPGLRLPDPVLSLDGKPLSAEDIASRRIDDSRPGRGGYEGRTLLEVTVTPPAAGRLGVAVPPLAVMEPGLGLRRLSLAPASLTIRPSARGAGAGASSEGLFDGAAAAAARLAAASAGLRRLPELLRLSRKGLGASAAARREALGLLSGSDSSGRDARYLEAALLWDGGDRGRALALLYGILRQRSDAVDVRRAADACSGELGSGPPLLDALPPPLPFALGGIVFLVLASSLALASRLAARRKRRPVMLASAILALALALGSLCASGVSVLERRRQFAVVWTDRLLLVPSPLAQGYVVLTRGSAARVRGGTAGYVGLVLGDGLEGWAPKKSVYYY